jgi:chaperone required for assembly of F1-ATPase
MRRFWKDVTLEPSTFGHMVRLDGRPVKTPKRNELALPTRKLADAVVAEWQAVDHAIDPAEMPMTGFANAAIDHIGKDRNGFVTAITAYGETDLLCYRAAAGEALAARQAEIWDAWLNWAQSRYDVRFIVVEGIMHRSQPPATLETLRNAVAARGTFELAAMAKLAHLSGSLVLTLAVIDQAAEAETLWEAACLDETWQEALWGSDHWAQKNRNDRKAEFMAAMGFLELLRTD